MERSAENLAVLVERELAVIDHLAAVMVGQHALGARGDPFHRPAQLARRPQHQRIVGERPALQAEAAADVGRDHADLVLRHVEDVRRAPCARRADSATRCRACRNRRRRCSRRWRRAAPSTPATSRLFSTRSLTTCLALAKAASVAAWSPNIRRKALLPVGLSSQTLGASGLAASSMFDHRRQRLVVDLDQFGGVARLRQRLGDHEGDAVADEAHLVGRPAAAGRCGGPWARRNPPASGARSWRRACRPRHRRRSAPAARRARPWPWRRRRA